MFQTRGFIFRKMVVYTVKVWYVLRAEITIKGFYKISEYKIFGLFKYIDMNVKHRS